MQTSDLNPEQAARQFEQWQRQEDCKSRAALTQLCELYLAGDAELKKAIRAWVFEKKVLLTGVARGACEHLDGTSGEHWLRLGLVAVGLSEGLEDYRDQICTKALLKYGVKRAGIDHPLFVGKSGIQDNADEVVMFCGPVSWQREIKQRREAKANEFSRAPLEELWPERATCTLPPTWQDDFKPLQPARSAAHERQWEEADRLQLPVGVLHQQTGIRLVLIPGGTYWIGAGESDQQAFDSEKPRHQVQLKPFYLALTPITELQWLRGRNDSRTTHPHRPQTRLSPLEAAESFAKLGAGLRLPSEAEWEAAARGGTDTIYWWGDEYRREMANGKLLGVSTTTDVAAFPPNPFGIYGVTGNVGEICADVWFNSYRAAPTDNSPQTGIPKRGRGLSSARVVRGGSYHHHPLHHRISYRGRLISNIANNSTGVRPALDFPTGGTGQPPG